MGTLKPSQLRSLVRMFRHKVEGAREQLVELVTARPDVVAELLGLPHETLTRVLAQHDPAEAVSRLLGDRSATPGCERARPVRAA